MSALVYEWRRLWSVRATWIMSLLYLAITAFFGAAPLWLGNPEPGSQSWLGLYNTNASILTGLILSVVAAQSFGHEYRYGTIRLTLTAFPARERVAFAKTVILSVYVTIMVFAGWSVLGFIGSIAPEGVITSDATGVTIDGGTPAPMWKVWAFNITYALFAWSITLITRNLALGVVLPLLMASLLEFLLVAVFNLAGDRLDWLANALPMRNLNDWLNSTMGLPHPGLVWILWVIGLYTIATLSFFKRDA